MTTQATNTSVPPPLGGYQATRTDSASSAGGRQPHDFAEYEVIRQHHDLRASITLVRVGAITDPAKHVYAVYRITPPFGEPSLGSFGCTCGKGSSRKPCRHMKYADDPKSAAHLRGGKRVA